MTSILTEIIREYLPKNPPRRPHQRREIEEARSWIFSDDPISGEYVFGFEFICSYLGLDPSRIRAGIRDLEKGNLRSRLYINKGPGDNYPAKRKSAIKLIRRRSFDEEVIFSDPVDPDSGIPGPGPG